MLSVDKTKSNDYEGTRVGFYVFQSNLIFITPKLGGQCPKLHTLSIAKYKLHTLRYGEEKIAHLGSVQCFLWRWKIPQNYACFMNPQRKDCTPWECAMFSLMVRNSLELCLFRETFKKRLHTFIVLNVVFDGEKFLRIMPVLYTLTE